MQMIKSVDKFIQQSTWKDFTLIKICLCSVGVMLGIFVPIKKKRAVLICAADVFAMSYVPLMIKFIKIVFNCDRKKA